MEKPEKPDFRVIEYPFHLGDLVGGTTNLDDSQFGAYMRLLIANINAQAKLGGLSNNQEILRSYTRMGPAAWKKLWLLIGDKFVHENGKIYHPRVKETVNEIIKASNTQRAKVLKRHEGDHTAEEHQKPSGTTNPETHKPRNHKPKDINPDSSDNSRAKESGSGFSILEKGGAAPSRRGRAFDIEHHLSDKDRETAKGFARVHGWDFFQLMREYNTWIGTKGVPDKPAAAFIAFVKKKTAKAP